MPDGEVDNFLIPCFCRMLFKDKHPSSSGRHYFFPHVGVCIFSPSSIFLILCKLLLSYAVINPIIYYFFRMLY
jgi:hypothetical protein